MSAAREFLVPDLGEGLDEATIIEWHVGVGDQVELNQPLCTVETHKAQVEIPSPNAGLITELGGTQGQTLPVGSVLAVIEVEPDAARPTPVLVGYGADDSMDGSRRRVRAKPPVRKLAADLDVDVARVHGSGPGGIVTRDDVLAALDAGNEQQAVTGVRLAMARRMALSRREIPDATASIEVDATELVKLRQRCHAAGAVAVTPFVLILRLLVIALRRHPVLNATWVDAVDGPHIRQHEAIHLGIAVAAARGLLVPVVTDAQHRTTRQLAGEVDRLITAAREGVAKPVDLQGSTFTVSNFGALGIDDAIPVINHPEAAILGVGTLKPRAVVHDGAVVARPTVRLTCAFDHRVADGAQVGAFLGELRSLIAAPELALLDL
ncbi:dihydrolipoamide acetyltransferase family protein [Mycobacterium sp. SMC-4]|uniref:dihydrolipoamide acetyltransferase family protein n=1 Tax=Mycobacterium sp. SMC-4 TaxID=2857059 RepID=UPI0021B40336|nr:dihydrolipoamide acetyltransferase family protein [Mycobacterium sp. SMC-4]UXA16499.1 2-oxo acid dehydrogenase subunit E2 [Mycobacterium sp. SMC-4]